MPFYRASSMLYQHDQTYLPTMIQLILQNISFTLLVKQLLNKSSTNTIMYMLFIDNYWVNNHIFS